MKRLVVLTVLLLVASAVVPVGAIGGDGTGQGHSAGRAVMRTTLFELFTNANNTNTADDENATARLANFYPRSRLAVLEWFEAGSPLAAPESQERFLYYGVVNPPHGQVDGKSVSSNTNNETQTYNAYNSEIMQAMNVSPSASITGKATLNGLNGSVNSTIAFTERISGIGLYVYCFLYEDGVNYKGTNNVTFHKYVVRKQVGKASFRSGNIQSGESFFANFSFTVDPAWNKANMGAVIALQSDVAIGTTLHPVHQSAVLTFSVGATYAVAMSPHDQSLDMFSGKSSQVGVSATNNGTATDTLDFSVTGPASSWASLSKASAVLAPGEQATLVVSIMVPAGTAPGEYMIKVKGTSRSDPGKTDEATITVNIKEVLVYGVSMSPSSAQEEVNAGDSATFQIRVKNTGSLDDTIDLVVQGQNAAWASLSKTSVNLPPNGEEAVTLTVSVPSEVETGRYDFVIKATSRGDATKTTSVAAAVKVAGQSTAVYGVDIQPRQATRVLAPGGSATITLTVNNTGNINDTIDFSKTGDASAWALLQPISLSLDSLQQGTVNVDVELPASTTSDRYTLTVRATSRGDGTKRADSVITIDVSIPEEPPKIDTVTRTPDKPTSKEVVTVSVVASGSLSYAELTYTEGTVAHAAQRMAKSGTTFTYSMGPFKATTFVKYQVTVYSPTGKSNRSVEYSFTVKAAPTTEQPTPGFETLAAVAAIGIIALVAIRRRR